MIEDQSLRFECLRLATSSARSEGSIVKMAQNFYEFVADTNDSKIIDAARKFVEEVDGRKTTPATEGVSAAVS